MRSRSYNALGLARLYCLDRRPRERAVDDRTGGGGPNPYRHGIGRVRDCVYEGVSRKDAIERLEAIANSELAEASVDYFRRILLILDAFAGAYIKPTSGEFPSPNRVFQITAKSHVSIETNDAINHIQFWNNKTTELYLRPAEIAAVWYDRAIKRDLFKPNRFFFYNLRTNNSYVVESPSELVKVDAENFLVEIEKLVQTSELRRALKDARKRARAAADSVAGLAKR